MASLAGYNPNTSMLPSGGGTIQAMSGGGGEINGPPPGFSQYASMLPSAGGVINPYKGGALFNEPIQIIGGDNPSTISTPNISTPVVDTTIKKVVIPNKPIGLKTDKITKDSFQITWDNLIEGIPYTATAKSKSEGSTPIIATIDKNTATFTKLTPGTEYSVTIKGGENSSDVLLVTTMKEESGNNSNKNSSIKTIEIFGKELKLENPRKSDVLSDQHIEALKLFGLDGPGLSDKEKKDVLFALYDGQCNTDKPLIFLQSCEPIRRIVQSLAINFLKTLEPTVVKSKVGDIKNESLVKNVDKPTVEYIPTDDGGMKICISFKKDQLGQISKTPLISKPKNKGKGIQPVTGSKLPGAPTEPEDIPKSSIPKSSPLTEEELDDFLADLNSEFSAIDILLSNDQKKQITKVMEQLKKTNTGPEPATFTPEELQELDDLLESLKEPILKTTTAPLTFDEMKQRIAKLKGNVQSKSNKPTEEAIPPTKLEGGYDLLTTKGIDNNNNNCFCISTIQMLYSIPEIRNAFLSYKCDDITIDESTLNGITEEQISQSIEAKYKNKDEVSDVVDTKMILCTIKKIIELLNEKTSTFEQLNKDTATSILSGGPIPKAYTLYIIKVYVAYLNKKNTEENKKRAQNGRSQLPMENINKQQDADEFITNFIFKIMEADNGLKSVLNIFNYREDKVYECEKLPSGEKMTKESRKGDTEKVVRLGVYNYNKEKKNPKGGELNINSYKMIGSDKYVPIDKVIEWSQVKESMTGDNEILGCGAIDSTPGAKEEGQTKGPGVVTNTFVIPDENKYLLMYTTKYEYDMNADIRRFDTKLKVLVEPEIIVDNKVYHIFGSIMFGPTGDRDPQNSTIIVQKGATGGGGHYYYDRFYIKDDEKPTQETASDLPFVEYNDSNVTFGSLGGKVEDKCYMLVYRYVKTLEPKRSVSENEENWETARGLAGQQVGKNKLEEPPKSEEKINVRNIVPPTTPLNKYKLEKFLSENEEENEEENKSEEKLNVRNIAPPTTSLNKYKLDKFLSENEEEKEKKKQENNAKRAERKLTKKLSPTNTPIISPAGLFGENEEVQNVRNVVPPITYSNKNKLEKFLSENEEENENVKKKKQENNAKRAARKNTTNENVNLSQGKFKLFGENNNNFENNSTEKSLTTNNNLDKTQIGKNKMNTSTINKKPANIFRNTSKKGKTKNRNPNNYGIELPTIKKTITPINSKNNKQPSSNNNSLRRMTLPIQTRNVLAEEESRQKKNNNIMKKITNKRKQNTAKELENIKNPEKFLKAREIARQSFLSPNKRTPINTSLLNGGKRKTFKKAHLKIKRKTMKKHK